VLSSHEKFSEQSPKPQYVLSKTILELTTKWKTEFRLTLLYLLLSITVKRPQCIWTIPTNISHLFTRTCSNRTTGNGFKL